MLRRNFKREIRAESISKKDNRSSANLALIR
jgi:hypothetical protein